MEPTPKYGIFSSSVNSQELSTTVQALTRSAAGLLVFSGIITIGDSTTLLNGLSTIFTDVVVLAPLGYSIWNASELVFGVLRKVIVWLSKKV